MRTHSTKQLAKLVGVHWITLLRWAAAGQIKPSQVIRLNSAKIYCWTDADVEKVRRFKGTLKPGPKPKKRKK